MKKILMILTLNLVLMQSFINGAENSESDALMSDETKENIIRNGALATGVTLGLWGIWGMRHHWDSVRDGYFFVRDSVYEHTKDRPYILGAFKYSLPIASLTASYYLIKYAQSKDKKEKKHSSFKRH